MKRLHQEINLNDDSFSYSVGGVHIYRVDSHGGLTRKGKGIGYFKPGENHQWLLYLGDELYMSSKEGCLFCLPEFELEALTELANSTARPGLSAD